MAGHAQCHTCAHAIHTWGGRHVCGSAHSGSMNVPVTETSPCDWYLVSPLLRNRDSEAEGARA